MPSTARCVVQCKEWVGRGEGGEDVGRDEGVERSGTAVAFCQNTGKSGLYRTKGMRSTNKLTACGTLRSRASNVTRSQAGETSGMGGGGRSTARTVVVEGGGILMRRRDATIPANSKVE